MPVAGTEAPYETVTGPAGSKASIELIHGDPIIINLNY